MTVHHYAVLDDDGTVVQVAVVDDTQTETVEDAAGTFVPHTTASAEAAGLVWVGSDADDKPPLAWIGWTATRTPPTAEQVSALTKAGVMQPPQSWTFTPPKSQP